VVIFFLYNTKKYLKSADCKHRNTVIGSTSISDIHWTDGRKRCIWSPL